MFKAMVRKAKQQYWGNRIAGCQDRSKLWSVVAWHKYSARLNPPPIQHNGILIQDPVGKAEALWEAIGERFSSDDDLPEDPLEDWQDSDKDPRLAWSCEVTMEELEKATIGPKNTAPGIDRTTIGLMKKCWDILKSWYLAIVRRCLHMSHFPAPWKEAEVSFMPKVGKKDLSTFRSWRPMALLSCQGKGYERVLARRISWMALRQAS